MDMDNETAKYISSLKEILKALTIGLESAVLVMEKWDEIDSEKKIFIINNLKTIIENSTNAYSHKPTKH